MKLKLKDIVRKKPFKDQFPVAEKVVASIVESGFYDEHFPVQVWKQDGQFILWDGHSRYAGAEKLGLEEIPVEVSEFETEAQAGIAAWRANANRRHLTEKEIQAVFEKVDKWHRQEAKRRMKAGKPTLGPKGTRVEGRRSSDDTAATLGIPKKKARRIREAFTVADFEQKRQLRAGEISVSEILKQNKPKPKKEEAEGGKVEKGDVVCEFVTRQRKNEEPVVCPHFWELKYANGCPFDCAWCYLKGTYYGKTQYREKQWDRILDQVLKAHKQLKQPTLFNAGEVADGLGGESKNDSSALAILGLLAKLQKHRVLFLTKTDVVGHLVNAPAAWREYAVMSWSLNAEYVSKKWERGAPSMDRRVAAAKAVSDAGFEVRIRIDPIVPVSDWQDHYRQLVKHVFDSFMPSRVTLGTLRLVNRRVLTYTWDKAWTRFFTVTTGWGSKMSEEQRLECYQFVAAECVKRGLEKIGVCKETQSILDQIGNVGLCNCEA